MASHSVWLQLDLLCSNILSFHRHARKDIPDLVAGCFRNGKYFKLPEFYSMNNRLDRGHAGWTAALLLAAQNMSRGEVTVLHYLCIYQMSSVQLASLL